MGPNTLYGIGLIVVPLLLSLTLHEYGHARVAMAFGDHTARLEGRVSLNPLVHLDPIGTICLFFGPVGWARPVPVNPDNLYPRRKAEICVSLAGVGMNLLLVVLGAVALNVMAAAGVSVDPRSSSPPTTVGIGAFMLSYLMIINLAMTAFNLIPLFPLDGHHVVRELLPPAKRRGFMEFQVRSGKMLLFGLLILPWLIGKITSRVILNPIGLFLGTIIWPTIKMLLGSRAEILFSDAWGHYAPYLPWG